MKVKNVTYIVEYTWGEKPDKIKEIQLAVTELAYELAMLLKEEKK